MDNYDLNLITRNKLLLLLSIAKDEMVQYAKMIMFWILAKYLYEEHLHRMTMENNTRQIIEELKLQTKYLREVRGSAKWEEAGTGAAAAGIRNN